MKNIILFGFLITFLGCSSLKYLKPFDGFNGKVNEFESTAYKIQYKDTVATSQMRFKSVWVYDIKGRKVNSLNYKSDGTPSSGRTDFFYDKNGNLVKKIAYNVDSTINVQINYKYNKYGQEIKKEYILDGEISVTERIYDRKNRSARIIGKNSDGSFKENAIQKYDDDWKRIELTSYDSINKLKLKIENIYDENGNKFKSNWYNSNNNLNNYYVSTYNANNDRIKIEKHRVLNGKAELFQVTEMKYEYDKNGNMVREELLVDGKLLRVRKNKFKYFE